MGYHAGGGGGGGGGGTPAPDPTAHSANILELNESSSTSGTTLGTVDFTGPSTIDGTVEGQGVTVGGAGASNVNVSVSGNRVTITAAVNLTPGDTVITLTIGAYTTGNITITTLPDTSTLLMIGTSDGYIYWRHGGGSWNVDQVWAAASLYGVAVVESGSDILGFVCDNDQSVAADTLQSTDIVTPSWSGGTNVGGASYSVPYCWADSVNGYIMVGSNNGRLYVKATASVISDGNFSSPTTCRMNSGGDWSGGGYELVNSTVTFASGRIVACGLSGSAPGVPHVSTCDGAPTGTWTERTFGTWTVGYARRMCTDGTTLLAVGSSSTVGVLAYSTDEGETWDTTTTVASRDYRGCACKPDGSVWVAVGASGAIEKTTDPTSVAWTSQTSGTTETLFDVFWDDGAEEFVTFGSGGVMLSSPDGETWSAESYPAGTTGDFLGGAVATTSAPT